MSKDYGADQIQILEGLEAVRKRPGMYIGSTSSRGLHHLVYEIVDNAVDEALAGYCTEIDVSINPDNSITVVDNGRGIPVEVNKKKGISSVEVVFTILHAGGKFGGGGYKVSGGLHGVGASVVNALSNWLEVIVDLDGKSYRQRYERGKAVTPLTEFGTTDRTGSTVTFLPDDTIFEETIFDYDILKERLRETAFLTKGLKIRLMDKREEPEKENSEVQQEKESQKKEGPESGKEIEVQETQKVQEESEEQEIFRQFMDPELMEENDPEEEEDHAVLPELREYSRGVEERDVYDIEREVKPQKNKKKKKGKKADGKVRKE